MSSTVQAIEGFEALVNSYKVEERGDPDKILQTIEKVRATTPDIYHQDHISAFLAKRAEIINKLIDDYLVASVKYPLLNRSMFSLRRWLQLRVDNKAAVVVKDETSEIAAKEGAFYNISMPLFASINIQGIPACLMFKNSINLSNGSKLALEITANMPGVIGNNLRKLYKSTLADAYLLLANMLNEPGIGDCLTENLHKTSIHPEVLVCWIPTSGSLSIKSEIKVKPRPDPAMLLKLRDQYFLVSTWAVDDEEPLDHFLREYTEGSLKNVKKA